MASCSRWVAQASGTVHNPGYINRRICSVDNGRVLGYDNSHEYHHRHFMGTVEPIEFENYKSLSARFEAEVKELWKRRNEND
jgi:hypothetical protein